MIWGTNNWRLATATMFTVRHRALGWSSFESLENLYLQMIPFPNVHIFEKSMVSHPGVSEMERQRHCLTLHF